MLLSVWDSDTKLENVFQYTTLCWGIVVAKFLKTKHLSNSGVCGFKTLFFIDWDKRFEVYACISPQNVRYISQIQPIVGFPPA